VEEEMVLDRKFHDFLENLEYNRIDQQTKTSIDLFLVQQ
jgi:hypothetical protein